LYQIIYREKKEDRESATICPEKTARKICLCDFLIALVHADISSVNRVVSGDFRKLHTQYAQRNIARMSITYAFNVCRIALVHASRFRVHALCHPKLIMGVAPRVMRYVCASRVRTQVRVHAHAGMLHVSAHI